MLQCMRESEDVQEYLDGEMEKFHIRRLLEWLTKIDVDATSTSAPVFSEVSLRSILPLCVVAVSINLVFDYPRLCLT